MKVFVIQLLFIVLLSGCAAPSKIEKYRDYLNSSTNVEIYYDEVINKLGDPDVTKEFENDFVSSWSRTFNKKADIATTFGGEKLLITFDKNNKKLLKWDYKKW
ncbi:MAG: hypothetical protein Q8K98_03675 [Bacteroidota bacterium]|nr:hypothetical protein [Bacteroidota bacterium]